MITLQYNYLLQIVYGDGNDIFLKKNSDYILQAFTLYKSDLKTH